MISARELAIVWGDTPDYWKWISVADTRYLLFLDLLLYDFVNYDFGYLFHGNAMC